MIINFDILDVYVLYDKTNKFRGNALSFFRLLFTEVGNVPERFIFDKKVIIVEEHKQARWWIGRSDVDRSCIERKKTIFIRLCFYI